MSKTKWRNLCFPSFIKCLPTSDQPSNHFDYHTIPPPPPPSTTATCTSHLIKDVFNSIVNDFSLINSPSDPDNTSTSKCLTSSSQDDFFSASSSDSDSDHFSPPNFATVLASDRFFFSSPGSTNSIIQSPNSTIPTTNADACKTDSQKRKLVTRGVRVPKYSSNPYMDFRKSMEEMLEANQEKMLVEYGYGTSTSDDMEYLHELLLCYLSLNPKHAHKDIISAFTDLVIGLLSVSPVPPASKADYENVKSCLISKS